MTSRPLQSPPALPRVIRTPCSNRWLLWRGLRNRSASGLLLPYACGSSRSCVEGHLVGRGDIAPQPGGTRVLVDLDEFLQQLGRPVVARLDSEFHRAMKLGGRRRGVAVLQRRQPFLRRFHDLDLTRVVRDTFADLGRERGVRGPKDLHETFAERLVVGDDRYPRGQLFASCISRFHLDLYVI